MNQADVIALLTRHGIRPTANRILIARLLADKSRPLSLAEMEDEIATIDKSGIFRTLSLFREQRLVHVIEDGGDGVRYELCRSRHEEEDDDVHVHFYCEQCRKTFCLENLAIPAVDLPDGYRMDSVNYMVKGICPACRP